MKLISNCTTLATTAIYGVPIAEAANTPGMREIMLRSGAEALAVGQDIGLRIEPIFGLSKTMFSRLTGWSSCCLIS